jgi:hypothetical protein
MNYTHQVKWTRHWVNGSLDGCRATDSVKFVCGEHATNYADFLRGITHRTFGGQWVAEDIEVRQLREAA